MFKKMKWEIEGEREKKSVIEFLDEYANRKYNFAHQKSTHCEKRVVLDGRREMKQTLWKIH